MTIINSVGCAAAAALTLATTLSACNGGGGDDQSGQKGQASLEVYAESYTATAWAKST